MLRGSFLSLFAALATAAAGAVLQDGSLGVTSGGASAGAGNRFLGRPTGSKSHIRPGFAGFTTATPPRIPSRLTKPLFRDGRLDPGYFIVHFDGPITGEDRAFLDDLTAPVRRADGSELARWYVPNNALVVWVDSTDAWLALRHSERTDWIGRYEPAYKIDPSLAAKAFGSHPLALSLDLIPGHPLERVLCELDALGVRVQETIQHRGRGTFDLSFLAVEAQGQALSKLAFVEGIRLVRERSAYGSLANESLSAELDSLVATELGDASLLPLRVHGDPGAPGYHEVSQLVDLLAYDNPRLLTCLELDRPVDADSWSASVKNALAFGVGQMPGVDLASLSKAEETIRRALLEGRHSGQGPILAPSSALVRALLIHGKGYAGGRAHGLDLTEVLDNERAGHSLIARDVPASEGFAAAGDDADVLALRSLGSGEPLGVTLVWTDEPGPAGTGGEAINDLDLVLRAPDGRRFHGSPLDRIVGRTGSWEPRGQSLCAEGVLLDNAQAGDWQVTVRPARGSYSSGQGYALVVTGDLQESGGGPRQELNVITTLVLRVTEGLDSKDGPLLPADVALLQSSDDDRARLRSLEQLALGFDRSVPADAIVSAVRIFTEHFEKQAVVPGEITWKVGHGPLANPTITETIVAPHRAEGAEALDVWSPSGLPSDLNDLRFVVENNSPRDDTILDWVFVEVDYTLPEAPLIESSPNPTGVVGEPYIYDANNMAEASGTAPITWSVVNGPAGFSIQAGTGRIAWTPAVAGSFPITIRATNVAGSDVQSFVVDVANPTFPPAITTTPPATGVVGQPFGYDANASGTTPMTWSVVSAPAGFAIQPVTGLVAWTPSAPGSFSISIRASNVAGSDIQSFVVDVANPTFPPAITTTPPATGVVGQPFGYDANASGTTPMTWSVVSAPAGFAIQPVTGLVAWTPAASGSFAISIRVTNEAGAATQSFVVSVADPVFPPTITSTPPLTGVVGQAYGYDADASGTLPMTWSVVSAPAGFSIQAGTGLVAWTPSASGSFAATIRATNSAGHFDQDFTVVVTEATAPPTILSVPNLNAVFGLPYRYDADDTALASGTAPITWTVRTGAPEGFAIDRATGFVTWTPSVAGTFPITIRASNAQGNDIQSFVVDVTAPPMVPPTILSAANGGAVAGVPYHYDANDFTEASGTPPILWSVRFDAPPGFAIDANSGRVTWTPTTVGSFSITIKATNDFGAATQQFVVDVEAPPVVFPTNSSSVVYCPPERLASGPAKPQQRLNVFLPLGNPPATGWPLVLNNRAGGGAATLPLSQISNKGATAPLHAFLASGIAVVDYGVTDIGGGQGLFYPPGHPSGRYESYRPADDNPEKDAEWAIQWVKTQTDYPLNGNSMCVRGASQGAMISIWATMGPERARTSGSAQVRASTRVKAVLALHPPTSFWAFDQGPALQSDIVQQFEQEALPGVPATALSQVAEGQQKKLSIMRYAFRTVDARANNMTQAICLLYDEPVKRVNGEVADMTLDATGFPKLHDTLQQPLVHDSWSGYVFYNGLIGMSAASAAFHGANSIFAIRNTSALAPPNDAHTRTFTGDIFGQEASTIAHDWVLQKLNGRAATRVPPPQPGSTIPQADASLGVR